MTTQAQNLCLFVSYGAYVIISDTINRHRGQRCRGKQSSTAEFYKLWKLLLTKPQKHKTTQSSACSVYIERDKVFFTFLSSWMSKRLSNTPKKNKDSVNKLKSCAWKVSVEYLVALKCWRNNLYEPPQQKYQLRNSWIHIVSKQIFWKRDGSLILN